MINYQGLIDVMQNLAVSLNGILAETINFKLFIPQNATIELDEITGNYVRSETTNLTYSAQVKVIKGQQEKDIIGDRTTIIMLTGYLISPLNFSQELTFQVDAELLLNGNWISGNFYPILDIETSVTEAYQFRKALGDKITGYFEIPGNPSNVNV